MSPFFSGTRPCLDAGDHTRQHGQEHGKKEEKQQRLAAVRERQRGREKAAKRWVQWAWRCDRLHSCRQFSPCIHHFCPETLHFPSPPRGAYIFPLPASGLDQGTDFAQWHGSTHDPARAPSALPITRRPRWGRSRGTPLCTTDSRTPSADACAHSETSSAGTATLRCVN